MEIDYTFSFAANGRFPPIVTEIQSAANDGPRLPRAIPGKVSIIDCTECTNIETDGLIQHSYYLSNPTVVSDMQSVLTSMPSKIIKPRDYDPETNRYRL